MNPQELESPKTMIRNVCAKQGLATVRMAIRQNSFFMDCSGWGNSTKRCFCREIRRWVFLCQGGLILGARDAEAAVLANVRTLVALCAFAPLSLEVGFLRHVDWSG